ncbi:hypothetical protein E3E36_10485 [Thermococcus sp. M36]|uniref:hypothetical protein n=1 Tax=Thermococcus sp. M36 TaxID=1638261 RepID=UPI00143A2EB3|nr:hypothetical protein [Thermococcus sp. M36]NJE06554.1 hypothetical protein [Thermococcus sp. M36]
MKRLMALFLIGFVILASGCIGDQVGLTKEKVLTAIENIETARYDQNFSMSMHIMEEKTNKTFNFNMIFNITGVFNRTSGFDAGNMSFSMHFMGMDVNMDWPYFVNGTQVFFKIDGKRYNATDEEDISSQARGSMNIIYIEKLLESKNVTIKKLASSYAFRVNVTFWEIANATNQTGYLLSELNGDNVKNITTNEGWIEVHLREDGTPVYIEEYLDLTMVFEDETVAHVTVHESIRLHDINEPVKIRVPEEIENAPSMDEAFW